MQVVMSPNQTKEGRFVLLTPMRGQGEVKLFLFDQAEWEQFKLGEQVELTMSEVQADEQEPTGIEGADPVAPSAEAAA